jgi:hypothetical protein
MRNCRSVQIECHSQIDSCRAQLCRDFERLVLAAWRRLAENPVRNCQLEKLARIASVR